MLFPLHGCKHVHNTLCQCALHLIISNMRNKVIDNYCLPCIISVGRQKYFKYFHMNINVAYFTLGKHLFYQGTSVHQSVIILIQSTILELFDNI